MTTTGVLSAQEDDGALWLPSLVVAGWPTWPRAQSGAASHWHARRRAAFADLNCDVLALVIRNLVRWEFPLDAQMRARVVLINKVCLLLYQSTLLLG